MTRLEAVSAAISRDVSYSIDNGQGGGKYLAFVRRSAQLTSDCSVGERHMPDQFCERCRQTVSLSGYLVHQRHCSKRYRAHSTCSHRDSELYRPDQAGSEQYSRKPRKLPLFEGFRRSNEIRIGPGAPGRREDLGLLVDPSENGLPVNGLGKAFHLAKGKLLGPMERHRSLRLKVGSGRPK